MTVLVLSEETDATARRVIDQLVERGAAVTLLDPGDFPLSIGLSATLDAKAPAWTTVFTTAHGPVDLGEVRSVYYRRPTVPRMPEGMSEADAAIAVREARRAIGGLVMSLPVFWVNHPESAAASEYKPLQLHRAAAAGLTIPPTYIGNDLEAARSFAKGAGGEWICKRLSHGLLIEDGISRTTWTTRVDIDAIDAPSFAVTAHLIQQWTPKQCEARVIAAGDRTFTTLIHAHSDRAHIDWRSDYDSLTYESISTPAPVAAGIASYLERAGLAYGAFDFIVRPDGEWVFLECNPSGQWEWLEAETGAAISAAIAELLVCEA